MCPTVQPFREHLRACATKMLVMHDLVNGRTRVPLVLSDVVKPTGASVLALAGSGRRKSRRRPGHPKRA